MQLPTIRKPYLLFLGNSPDLLTAKTAVGVAHWRRDWCIGQMRLPGCAADTGLPDMDIAEAAARGAGTLVIGVATTGGVLPNEPARLVMKLRQTHVPLVPLSAPVAVIRGERASDGLDLADRISLIADLGAELDVGYVVELNNVAVVASVATGQRPDGRQRSRQHGKNEDPDDGVVQPVVPHLSAAFSDSQLSPVRRLR